MPDKPKELPELIAILRLGSMIPRECSAGHEVVVKGRQRERHPNTRMVKLYEESTLPRLAKQFREGTMKTVVTSLCALVFLSYALVSCGGADAEIVHPRVVVGDQNAGVLHGKYI
jgi:hypothetical protein